MRVGPSVGPSQGAPPRYSFRIFKLGATLQDRKKGGRAYRDEAKKSIRFVSHDLRKNFGNGKDHVRLTNKK